MTSRKEMDAAVSRLPVRAWQHAMIVLGDEPRAAAMVARAMDLLVTHYAHAIKNDFQRLFYRIFLNLLRQTECRQSVSALPKHLLQALIPRREDPAPVHPLESLQLTDPAVDADWPRRATSRQAVASALGLLPARQRQAFLLLQVDGLAPPDAAYAAGCSRRALLRRHARALRTLGEIFAVKGCTLAPAETLATCLAAAMPQPTSVHAAALAATADACFEKMNRQRRRPAGRAAALRAWRLRHPAQARGAVLLCLALLGAGLLWRQLPGPAPDPAQTDLRLLTGEVPLEILADPAFEEAENE